MDNLYEKFKPILHLTNHEKWQLLCRDLPAPQTFIDMSFYFMIGAALQRRVWLGTLEHKPLFPNLYIALVGTAGLGKGIVIDPLLDIIGHHPLELTNNVITADELREQTNGKVVTREELETMRDQVLMEAQDVKTLEEANKKANKKPILIPMAPNATTYESLVSTMAKSLRRINYDKELHGGTGLYTHSSLCVGLTEMGSLFSKKSENIVNFLLQAYDSGKEYTKTTKTQGEDYVKRPCLALIAGTTPDFMEEVFTDKLLSQGFSSRCWFIFETRNRFSRWDFTSPDKEQTLCKEYFLLYVKALTRLFGECKFNVDANAFMKHWWECEMASGKRANKNPKLDHYYARKNIHSKKLSTIIHYCNIPFEIILGLLDRDIKKRIPPSNEITLTEAQLSLFELARVEEKMHLALTFGSGNPLFRPSQKIMKYIERREVNGEPPATYTELLIEFFDVLAGGEADLKLVLEHFTGTGKLIMEGDGTGNSTYKLPKPEDKPTEEPLLQGGTDETI